MINHQPLTPLTPTRPRLLSPSPIGNPSVQQEVVDLPIAELVQRLRRKPLDSSQIRQLQRQDLEGVGIQRLRGEGRSISFLRAGYIPGAEYEVVWLRGLRKEVLDYVETLCWGGGVLVRL